MRKSEVKIETVVLQSPADKAGLKSVDQIISINRHPIKDVSDLMFYGEDEAFKIIVERDEKIKFHSP